MPRRRFIVRIGEQRQRDTCLIIVVAILVKVSVPTKESIPPNDFVCVTLIAIVADNCMYTCHTIG